MSVDGEIEMIYQYYPPGAKKVIATGGSASIGEVDEATVLKYPLAPGREVIRLEIERKLLEVIGPHPRIIGFKGFSDTGIYLERAVNGTLAHHLLESGLPPPSTRQRVSWCREAAEAVAHIHSRRVLHCDIQPTNLLLDDQFHLKLADFQGRHLSEDGQVLLDGWSGEPCRFFCPRNDFFDADIKTDLFALGCNFHFIMMGHAVFPDIIDGEDGYREKVAARFEKEEFPQDIHACSTVTLKCWKGLYGSADELVKEIQAVEQNLQDRGSLGLMDNLLYDHSSGLRWRTEDLKGTGLRNTHVRDVRVM
ncbi:kinase-like domain-containing protein [Leptodontidium sp. 2 PMI_412]|nr:kinase-like domain-containing protein [Leptodontidium sp. 2 PMI_412]